VQKYSLQILSCPHCLSFSKLGFCPRSELSCFLFLSFKINPYMIHHKSVQKKVFKIVILKWGLKILLQSLQSLSLMFHHSKLATFLVQTFKTHFESLCEITKNSLALLLSSVKWGKVQWVWCDNFLEFTNPFTWALAHTSFQQFCCAWCRGVVEMLLGDELLV